jgi:uncharacterized heparinase superfamily protein
VNLLTRPALYWNTIRYLRPRQLGFQLMRRAPTGRLSRPRGPVPPVRVPVVRLPFPQSPTTGIPGTFRFLNVARDFDAGSFDWSAPDMSRLWRYNLHYFDYLGDSNRTAQEKADLLNSWIKHDSVRTASGWEPYPVSLRISNWIRYFLGLAPQTPDPAWLRSLWTQCSWLGRNIEYHLLANHLFKNAKALVFAGAYFEGDSAAVWLKTGSAILARELDEQFLSDGGHYERSPMYHAIAVQDVLDLLALGRMLPGALAAELTAQLRRTVAPALEFLADLTLADGQIALFNDSAFAIAPATAQLSAYAAAHLGVKARAPEPRGSRVHRAASGYYGWRGQWDSWLIDAGPVGPDYQPGHTHCDALSYELVWKGRRVVTDTGVHDYEAGPRRLQSRSTRGHNTVMVDDAEQSEIWGVFRVARRARIVEAQLTTVPEGMAFSGAHDGYRRLSGKVTHRRTAQYTPGRCLSVTDLVSGSGQHFMDNRIHFAPGLRISGSAPRLNIKDENDALVAQLEITGNPGVHIEQTEVYPEFGRSEACNVVRLNSAGRLPLEQQYTITSA